MTSHFPNQNRKPQPRGLPDYVSREDQDEAQRQRRKRRPKRNYVKPAVLAYMQEHPGEDVTLDELTRATGLKRHQMYGPTSKLTTDGIIERTGQGKYRLVSGRKPKPAPKKKVKLGTDGVDPSMYTAIADLPDGRVLVQNGSSETIGFLTFTPTDI